jgi:predicted metal-binding protein
MADMDTSRTPITTRPTHWRETILICKKCSKKMKGGFGPKAKTRLKKALAEKLALKKGRLAAIGLIEVGCFDLCPKRAVTVAKGSEPGMFYVVPRGAHLDEIIAALGLSEQSETPAAAPLVDTKPDPAPAGAPA